MSLFKKIFRSYDFRNNKIINAKTDTPTDNKHLANKEYVDTSLTYNTLKAETYKNPFKQWWMSNVFGKSLKTLLDDLLFPRIAPDYKNPELIIAGVLILDSDVISIAGNTGIHKKYLVYNDKQTEGRLYYGLAYNDRLPNPNMSKLTINYSNQASQTFLSDSNGNTGYIPFLINPGNNLTSIIFEKGFESAVVKKDTYQEDSITEEFSSSYNLIVDITEKIKNSYVVFDSLLISPLRNEEGEPVYDADFVIANFTKTTEINLAANTEGIFDILVPKSLNKNSVTNKYPFGVDLFQIKDDKRVSILQSILDWEWLNTYTNEEIIIINDKEYYKCQFNFGIHPINILIKFRFNTVENTTFSEK